MDGLGAIREHVRDIGGICSLLEIALLGLLQCLCRRECSLQLAPVAVVSSLDAVENHAGIRCGLSQNCRKRPARGDRGVASDGGVSARADLWLRRSDGVRGRRCAGWRGGGGPAGPPPRTAARRRSPTGDGAPRSLRGFPQPVPPPAPHPRRGRARRRRLAP
jgi:hypothetical protein